MAVGVMNGNWRSGVYLDYAKENKASTSSPSSTSEAVERIKTIWHNRSSFDEWYFAVHKHRKTPTYEALVMRKLAEIQAPSTQDRAGWDWDALEGMEEWETTSE